MHQQYIGSCLIFLHFWSFSLKEIFFFLKYSEDRKTPSFHFRSDNLPTMIRDYAEKPYTGRVATVEKQVEGQTQPNGKVLTHDHSKPNNKSLF